MQHQTIWTVTVSFLLCVVVSTATITIGLERYCFYDGVNDPTLRVPMADSGSMAVLLPPASRLQLIADNKTKCGYTVVFNRKMANIQIIYTTFTNSSVCGAMGVDHKKDRITYKLCCQEINKAYCINDKTTYDVYQEFVAMVANKWHGKVNVTPSVKPPLPPSSDVRCRYTAKTEFFVYPDIIYDHRLVIDVAPAIQIKCTGWMESCGGQIEMRHPFAINDTDCDPTNPTTCNKNQLWISYRCMGVSECNQKKKWDETPSRKRHLEAHFCCHTDDCNHLTVREVYRQYLERRQEEPVRIVPVADPLPTTTPTEPCGDYVTAAQMIVLLVLLVICLLTLLCVVGFPVIVKTKLTRATDLLKNMVPVVDAPPRTDIPFERPMVTDMQLPAPPPPTVHGGGMVTVTGGPPVEMTQEEGLQLVTNQQPLVTQQQQLVTEQKPLVTQVDPSQKKSQTQPTELKGPMVTKVEGEATEPSEPKKKKKTKESKESTKASGTTTKDDSTSSGSESTQSYRESQFIATKAREQSKFLGDKPPSS